MLTLSYLIAFNQLRFLMALLPVMHPPNNPKDLHAVCAGSGIALSRAE